MTMPAPLVIGFGNRLRSDDGTGLWLAEQLQAQRTPMQVLACQQLTPELAAAVGAAKAVLFVDASAADSADDSKAPRLSHLICRQGPARHGDPEILARLRWGIGREGDFHLRLMRHCARRSGQDLPKGFKRSLIRHCSNRVSDEFGSGKATKRLPW